MPSDTEINIIRQSILACEQKVTSIDKEIAKANDSEVIQRLLERKKHHLADITKCKEQITPITRLPAETLTAIFEQCIQDVIISDEGSLETSPLILSQVCSWWRQVTSRPILWSHLRIDVLNSQIPFSSLQLILNLWLRRSQDKPLTIELTIGKYAPSLNIVANTLVVEISRWRSLKIISDRLIPYNKFIHACNDPAPQLQTIDIQLQESVLLDANPWHSTRNLQNRFVESPQIHTVRINRNVLPMPGSLPVSITRLSLELPRRSVDIVHSMDRLVRLLQQLPKLECLTVEVPLTQYQVFLLDVWDELAVDLINLKSLTLSGPSNIFGLLPYIRVPSLNQLTLCRSVSDTSELTSEWLFNLLESSLPPISLLELDNLRIDEVAYTRIFTLLPSLETLSIHKSVISDVAFQNLNKSNGLCPSLKTVELRCCSNLSGDAVVQMGRSRLPEHIGSADGLPSSKPALEVVISCCPLVSEEDKSTLENLDTLRRRHRRDVGTCNRICCIAKT